MAERSYFFNSIPEDPRVYQADDFASYFRVLTENGVYKNGGNLEVTADGVSLKTKVNTGSAFIDGYRYENDEPLNLEHALADPTHDRIDLVVLRLDKNYAVRNIYATIKQGTPSSKPVAQELIDDGYIKEIPLAEVRIKAGQSFISQNQVTDKRGEIVNPIVDGTRITNLENTKADKLWGQNFNAVLKNGWSGTLTYSKNDHNIVWLRGVINAGTVSPLTVIATLPEGYRSFFLPSFNTVDDVSGEIDGKDMYMYQGNIQIGRSSTFEVGRAYNINIVFAADI